MDLKKMAEELVEQIVSNEDLLKKFKANPVATLEKLVGIDLPNDQLEKIADLVKAKIDMDKLGDALGALGGLFGKR